MSEEDLRQPLNTEGPNAKSASKGWPSLARIWQGPSVTRDLTVSMFWRPCQLLPERLLQNLGLSIGALLLLVLWVLWGTSNMALTKRNIMALSCLEKNSSESNRHRTEYVPLLNCGRNDAYWKGPGSKCGLNGENCVESLVGTTLSFRCPMNCKNAGWTYEPWPIGADEAMRKAVVIGGPGIYRGDSFICGAALHAGIITDNFGGCGTLEWLGDQSNFEGVAGANGASYSTAFNSSFPLSFRFKKDEGMGVPLIADCRDLRVIQILVNILFLISAAYFVPTAKSPKIFLLTMAIFGFWTVILASDPPLKGGTPEKNAEIISLGFKRLLPTLLGLLFIYVAATRPQLRDMHASLSRMIFWGGGYVVGILQNLVFAALPFDRFMISDLNTQPGAWFALGILGVVLFVIVLGQSYSFWLTGKFQKYLKGYLILGIGLALLSLWPDQSLRLHHYFFALLLIPGTGLKTTCSLFYQGLLVGLFVSGVARWDFDSILQTSQQLSRGASLSNAAIDPSMVELIQGSFSNTLVRWSQASPISGFAGYSILINDIERVRAIHSKDLYTEEQVADDMLMRTFNLTAWVVDNLQPSGVNQTFYVRVAGAFMESGRSLSIGEYSKALVANFF